MHVVLLLVFLRTRPPVRVSSGQPGPLTPGIEAFVNTNPGPVATAGVTPTVKRPKIVAPSKQTSTPSDTNEEQLQGSGGAGSTDGAGGPIRLGSGSVTLIKQVKPAYPRMLQAAGVQGSVVLEAIIHRDGTIGDIKVLSAASPLFAEAATDAVRQWRYAPLPYEGLVTVTVNFTLH